MKKNCILLLLLFSLPGLIKAQQNKFTIGIGYQRTWMLDKPASPLKYQSSEKSLSIGYDHYDTRGVFSAQINGSLGNFFPTGFQNRQMYNPGFNNDGSSKTDSFSIPGTIYNARIKLSYLKQTNTGSNTIGNNKLDSYNYVGASLSNQLFYTDNIVRTGWLNSSSLNAEYLHKALLNEKHLFTIKVSIPIFARNTRLPYHNTISSSTGETNFKTFFKEGSRFAWFGIFQNIQIDAGYEFNITNHFSAGIKYFGQWLHYVKEKPINIIQNNIGITASLK